MTSDQVSTTLDAAAVLILPVLAWAVKVHIRGKEHEARLGHLETSVVHLESRTTDLERQYAAILAALAKIETKLDFVLPTH